ncbi:MAG: ATP-binding protein [Actinomycetota bacterium]|nr:ATP-binding protein [Actinomycetota bacterium]
MSPPDDDGTGLFVLVGGWPGSGKTTLATAIASELGLPILAKDDIKEVLADELGRPDTVEASQRLGRAAVMVMLRIARSCPSAVLDSTWFDYTAPLVAELRGVLVEVSCVVPLDIARARYHARAAGRHAGHLDHLRTGDELWGEPSRPLGMDCTLEVDTSRPINAGEIATDIRRAATSASAAGVSTAGSRRAVARQARPGVRPGGSPARDQPG